MIRSSCPLLRQGIRVRLELTVLSSSVSCGAVFLKKLKDNTFRMARATESKQPLYTQNILAVDIGTTTISCHHFDRSGISLYHTSRKVGGSPYSRQNFFNLIVS